jgi:hypothetical protein
MKQAALTTLANHIDLDWLREAYRRARKRRPDCSSFEKSERQWESRSGPRYGKIAR